MNHPRATIPRATLSLAAALSCVAFAQSTPGPRGPDRGTPPTGQITVSADIQGSSSARTTPAQLRIAAAKLQIHADPRKSQAYNELALAFLRRARETGDPTYLREAEGALATGIALAPNDFQLQKTHVALLLARQQFSQAKKEATALNQKTPDDVMTYGYIAEADIALGNYQNAEASAQWMLNLLPYNVPGLLIAAELRDLYGDFEGAIECLDRAYTETSSDETEELAWILNQTASLRIHSGNLDAASNALNEAERLFPRYPYTFENRAELKLAQGKAQEAIPLLRELEQTPHVLYQMAKAEAAAGNPEQAELAYARFEEAARQLIDTPTNDNRELILYYASRADDSSDSSPASSSATAAQRSLDLAKREVRLRQDVWTLDAYAWALYVNGKYTEADLQIQKALAVGIRSDQVFDHAGHIALKLNRQPDAARYFEAVVQLNSFSEYLLDARKELTGVPAVAAPQLKFEVPPTDPSAVARTIPSAADRPLPVSATAADNDFSPVPSNLLTPRPTGTERVIRAMQSRVARDPKEAGAYSALGAAFLQRARETGDVEDYQLAEQSLKKSLDMASVDLSATAPLTTMAEVCMGEHRFQEALSYAQQALALGSGDLSPYAIAGDAYTDIGEYEKAGVAYSRLISDPGSEARTTYVRDSRLAYLKFISGNTDGSIQLMQSAVTAGIEAQLPSENLAWLYFELGEFYFQNGNVQAANHAYLAALSTHPGDYRALAGLAKLRANQGRYQEAIQLYEKAIAVVPMPVYVAELGDVYTKLRNTAEAEKQYQLVEYIGLLGHINQVLHNRDLALFYADHDRNLTESLALAQKEFEVRHDVYTWDALAWALYKNGKYQDAKDAMDNALHFGTKDSLLLFHAGMIEAKLGNTAQARDNLSHALKSNPHFHVLYADQARQQLDLFERSPAQIAGRVSSHGESDVH